MHRMALAGVVLVVVGAITLAYPAVTYTDRDEVIDVGGLEVVAETDETLRIPPIVGGVAIARGLVLLLSGRVRHGTAT